MDRVRLSKRLSYLLRHHPEELDLELTSDGYTTITINELADRLGVKVQDISEVVKLDKKTRFSIQDGRIRANYGHSISVGKKMYEDVEPIEKSDLPKQFYHGTNADVVEKIMNEGLKPRQRQYVHLSYTEEWAQKVGNRKQGKTVILEIDTQRTLEMDIEFYQASPTTILTHYVPPLCLKPLW